MKFNETFKASTIFRMSVYMTFIAIVFVIISYFYINSTIDNIRQKRAILDSRQNIQLNFEEVLSFYAEEYGTLRAKLDLIIPKKDEIAVFLENIEGRSKVLGIDTEIRNVPTEIDENSINFIRYQVSFDGNKQQLLSFVELLNNLPVYTEIQMINSASIDEFNFSQVAKHEVVFDIFVRNE